MVSFEHSVPWVEQKISREALEMTCQIGDKLGDLLISWTNSSLEHPIIKPVLLFATGSAFS
jgi:hypothetical protein